MTGYTIRPITASHTHPHGYKTIEQIPAGTMVHVGQVRDDGTCEIRLPGTLLTQHVHLADIEPA